MEETNKPKVQTFDKNTPKNTEYEDINSAYKAYQSEPGMKQLITSQGNIAKTDRGNNNVGDIRSIFAGIETPIIISEIKKYKDRTKDQNNYRRMVDYLKDTEKLHMLTTELNRRQRAQARKLFDLDN